MLSIKEIVCPNNLLNVAHKKKGVKAAIVNDGKPLPMISVQAAVKENLTALPMPTIGINTLFTSGKSQYAAPHSTSPHFDGVVCK